MMDENKKTPKVRFAGFADLWQQRKLDDISKITMGQSPDGVNYTENPEDNILIQGNADLYNGEVVPRIFTTQITKLSEPNDIIFTVRAPVGEVAKNDYTAVIGRGVASLTGNNFLYYILRKLSEINYWKKLSAGSTFDSINSEQLKNIKIDLPNKKEQKVIGDFFEKVDNVIILHQRKYEKLNQIKKSMLEKMFPRNGSNVPEIRFAGFTGAWEQRKLADIGEVITGSTPSTQHSEYYSEDGIPWVTPTDITENVISDTPKKLSPLGAQVGRVVPAKTILVTCIASIGKNTMLANTGSFNQQINGLVPNKREYDPYFLLTESYQWSVKMKREAAAGTMQIVNKNEFSAIETTIPKFPEQKAIGDYFRNLDNLIILHQRKYEKLRQIKKSLLEKMFV